MEKNNNFPLHGFRDSMEKAHALLEKAEAKLPKDEGLSESIKDTKAAIANSLKNLK